MHRETSVLVRSGALKFLIAGQLLWLQSRLGITSSPRVLRVPWGVLSSVPRATGLSEGSALRGERICRADTNRWFAHDGTPVWHRVSLFPEGSSVVTGNRP